MNSHWEILQFITWLVTSQWITFSQITNKVIKIFKIVSGLVFRRIEWTRLRWEIVTARSCQCRTSVLGFQLKHGLTKKLIQLNIFFQIGFNLKPIWKLLRSIKNWVSPTPVSMAYWFVFVFCFFGGIFPVRELGNWSKSARQPKKTHSP